MVLLQFEGILIYSHVGKPFSPHQMTECKVHQKLITVITTLTKSPQGYEAAC